MTVVFADLSGFTRLSERTDPEDVRALVDRCVARMSDIVAEHGGWFDKVMGDGVLAVFGAEVAHGDDAERAVRAALAIRQCASDHSEDFGGLALSIGVNTGEVMFAAVGPDGRRAQTVFGDAVNTAARLQAAAEPGTILVGEETWRVTRAVVQYDAMPPVQAKGKQEPVRAWSAVSADALHADRPMSEVPLVGRRAELDVLRTAWTRVVGERRPHLVTVLGPAGIGKTKLARTVAGLVEESGGRVFRGRCLPYGESTGYGAFAQALMQTASIVGVAAADDAFDALRRRTSQLVPDAEAGDVAEHVATLAGITIASGAEKHALFFSARRFVEELAREAPTALVFEDIHWADPTLLELIQALATRVRDAPMMILTLARPELLDRMPTWGGGVGASTSLTMSPLSEADARRLAAHHLGVEESSPTAFRLAEIGEGNPLFIEELSASVVERATDIDAALPTNVRTTIAARLDALPAAERAVLLDAAVIGKVFWAGALTDRHPGVGATLDALDRRDLIRREGQSQLEGEEEYSFRHMLIREVAYATLPRAARRDRHAAAALFIERAAGDRSPEWASTLAHHWREAGDRPRAVDHLVTAARRAGSASAAAEAAQLYTDALELLDDDDVVRRRELRLARGMARVQSAFWAEGVEDLDAALPELEGVERAEALLALGTSSVWLMDGHRARRCGEEALELARELDDDLVGPALSVLANGGAIDGDLATAIDLQRQSLAAWRPGTRPLELAEHLGMMALTSYWVGDNDDAIDLGRRSYDLGVEHQSIGALLQGGSHFAMALGGRGRHDEAIEMFEKVIAHGRELEAKPRLTSRTLNMMATTLREIGEDDEARLRNEEALDCARSADFGAAYAQGCIDLVFADIGRGELGLAEQGWQAARVAVDALAGWHQWLGLLRLAQARTEIAAGLGDHVAVIEHGTHAARQAARVGRRKYEALARAETGRAFSRLGRHDEALAEVAAAAALADATGHPQTSWRVDAARAAVLAAAGQDAEAQRVATRLRDGIEAFPLPLARRQRFIDSPFLARVLAEIPIA
ncbi:MAG TPA: adenylate/guanylate cyclase domain-containing protein [Acidimicrobiales bacterium]|nr:adenylate/guanylate cyclase domain-containing protein [Acidimicrobiales bacterium]